VRGRWKLGLLLAPFSISAAAAQGYDSQWQGRMHDNFENFAKHGRCINDNAWEWIGWTRFPTPQRLYHKTIRVGGADCDVQN
jgi:hypothetical protein